MGVLGQSVGNKHTELADGIFLRDSQGKKKKVCRCLPSCLWDLPENGNRWMGGVSNKIEEK